VDLTVSALESITVDNTTYPVTVPLAAQSAAAASLSTSAGNSCPATTDCVSYTLSVPASTPSVASQYTVDAQAFLAGAAPQTDCSPSDLQTNQTSGNAPLLATSGINVTASTLAFTGCN
jgi:hypothetical protein